MCACVWNRRIASAVVLRPTFLPSLADGSPTEHDPRRSSADRVLTTGRRDSGCTTPEEHERGGGSASLHRDMFASLSVVGRLPPRLAVVSRCRPQAGHRRCRTRHHWHQPSGSRQRSTRRGAPVATAARNTQTREQNQWTVTEAVPTAQVRLDCWTSTHADLSNCDSLVESTEGQLSIAESCSGLDCAELCRLPCAPA